MRWAIIWAVLIGLVLVPFFLFETQFNAFAERMTRSDTAVWLAASSIFGLLALDVLLPVPSSIVSTAAGVLLGFWRGAVVVWAGMMVACVLGYAIGALAMTLAQGLTAVIIFWAIIGGLGASLLLPAMQSLVHGNFEGAAQRKAYALVGAPYVRFLVLTALSNLGVAVGYAAFGAFSMSVNSFVVAFFGALLIPGIVMGIAKLTFSGR